MRKGLLLFALLVTALVGCENLDDCLTDDLTTTLTFYDEHEVELTACPYRIGTVLPADSLPKKFPEKKKGFLVGGWRFYQKETNAKYDVPTNVKVKDDEKDDNGIVDSVTVTSVPLSFQVVWWKPITYAIVFDGNGGHLADGNISHQEDHLYSESDGSKSVELTLWKNEFVRNGYDFNGWNVAENKDKTTHDYTDGEELTEHLADEEGAVVTLYACWLKKEITITFEAGEDTGTMEGATVTRKVGESLPACTFTAPDGKRFAGWKWDGRAELFADEDTLTEANYPNEDATFVAQWKWLPVTVTLDPNGGSVSPQTQDFEWGQPGTIAASVARPGYDFVGWNTAQDGNGSTTYANGQNTSFTQDTTLYAQWEPRFKMTEKSPEMEFNQTDDRFVFTAPHGSSYQWMLRSDDGTITSLGNGQTCTISYAEYDDKPAEYTLIVTVFDESDIPMQPCWAKFRVDPQR